jgi:hypothetical protein
MSFLQMWFAATGVIVAGFFMWAYVPILIPILVLAAGLGGLTFAIVALARFAERRMKKSRNDG